MDIDQLILKFKRTGRRPGTANPTLKGTKGGRLTLRDGRTYYKATVIKVCGISEITDTQIPGTEQRAQKWTHVNIAN